MTLGRRKSWERAGAGLVLGAWVAACSASRPPQDAAAEPLINVEAEREAAQGVAEPLAFSREQVRDVVEQGLGVFLQQVRVEASLVHGQFQGFRIVELQPPDAWGALDSGVGDVVTSVNGQSIERPEQAHAVFTTLPAADELRVGYLRRGQAREVVVPITGPALEPAPAPDAAPSGAAPSGAAPSGAAAPQPVSAGREL